MLMIKRKKGQWIELTHAPSGDRISIQLATVCTDGYDTARLAFDDPERRFEVLRYSESHAQRMTPPAP